MFLSLSDVFFLLLFFLRLPEIAEQMLDWVASLETHLFEFLCESRPKFVGKGISVVESIADWVFCLFFENSHEFLNRVIDYFQNKLRVLLLKLILECSGSRCLPIRIVANMLQLILKPFNSSILFLFNLIHFLLFCKNLISSISKFS